MRSFEVAFDLPREGELARIGDRAVIPLTFGRARLVVDDPHFPMDCYLDGW